MPDAKLLEENINFWHDRYNKNNIGWHIEDVHPQLIKHLNLFTASDNTSNSKATIKKFFIPLCGKTKDIPYLLSLGYEVFGVECVESAIMQLDEENSLNLKFDQAQSLYFTEDRRLQIYYGDFFTCPIEKWGPFDYIWDRGSFIAMDYPLRESYIKVVQRSVGFVESAQAQARQFRYLIQTVRYDKAVSSGPPKSVYEEDFAQYFQSWMKTKELERISIPEDSPLRRVNGHIDSDFYEIYFFGEPK